MASQQQQGTQKRRVKVEDTKTGPRVTLKGNLLCVHMTLPQFCMYLGDLERRDPRGAWLLFGEVLREYREHGIDPVALLADDPDALEQFRFWERAAGR